MMHEQLDAMRHADDVCAADPVQGAVRDELIDLERRCTQDGFDADDLRNVHLYQMLVNRETGQATSRPMTIMTEVVRFFIANLGQPVPIVLDMVSLILTNPELGAEPPSDAVRHSIDVAMREYEPQEGWEVYAVGVINQLYSMRADIPGADQIASMREVIDHPQARQCWYTNLVGSDSRIWTVLRQEGEQLVYATCGPDEPVDDPLTELTALTRFVNAATKS